MKKKKATLKIALWVCVAILIVLSVLAVGLWKGWFAKAPESYTWEEYLSMSNEERDELYQLFDSKEDFEAWKDSVEPDEDETDAFIWDVPGKLPNEYTWEDYQALSAQMQEAFFLWFETENAFYAWLNAAKPEETTEPAPTWGNAEKNPDEYDWESYQALSQEEKDAFYQWFTSVDEFEAWMERVKPAQTEPTVPEWDQPGKLPSSYTWEEYQALSNEEQESFYHWFESGKAFQVWMDQVKPNEDEPEVEPWDSTGKLPNEYTWEEYQALSPEQQDSFYLWFDSRDAFEAWLEAAQNAELD